MSNVITFPARPVVVDDQSFPEFTLDDYKRQHIAWCASLPLPTPASQPVLKMSSWTKWRLTRAIQADKTLSAAAVLVAVHLIDWWSERNGFAAPSASKLCDAARLRVGNDRKCNMESLHQAIDELTRRKWFKWEFYENKPGSGFPGRKFIITANLAED